MQIPRAPDHARLVLTLALALASSGPAAAQTSVGPVRVEGEIGVGGWITAGDDGEGKLLEYRDLDDGAVGEYRLLFEDEDGRYFLRSTGANLGYDDERYELEFGRYGRFTFDAFLRELPHVFSTDARTLYFRTGDSTFVLPPGVQGAIAGAADPSAQLATELLDARDTDLEFDWLEAGGGLDFRVNEGLRLFGSYRLQDKNGNRAHAIDWGTPGGNFAAFPLRVDEKIHELKAGAEWLVGDHSVSLEYLGSFFENEIREATVDNPLVAIDAADAASRGRLGLSPDNAAHSVALSGAARLPFEFPARAVASFVYGVRLQDQSFLPHTINPVILPDPSMPPPGLALPEGNLDGRVETWLANVVLDADPLPGLDLGLRYRLYRYDNRSDELLFEEHVNNDGELSDSPRRSVANDYTVHKLGSDASYAISKRVTGHLGYGWEYWNRSDDRQVEDLHEHGPTAKLDYRHSPQTSIGVSYAFRSRDGDGYDPFAFFDEVLDADGQDEARRFGELPELVKYDQADRDLHRADFQARSLLGERLELTFSGAVNFADYRNTDFGLTEELGWNVGGEAWYQPHPRVAFGLFYDFEALEYEQDSRWRPRSFFVPPPGEIMAVDDPSNDWDSRTRSRFHTTGANIDVALIPQRVDLQLGYEFHYGRERTTSSGSAGLVAATPPTTSGDGGRAVFFPEIEERLQAVSAGLTFRLTEELSLLTQYRFEAFDLDDDDRRQGLGPFIPGSNVNGDGNIGLIDSTDIFLANDVEDYQAHIFRLIARLRF